MNSSRLNHQFKKLLKLRKEYLNDGYALPYLTDMELQYQILETKSLIKKLTTK